MNCTTGEYCGGFDSVCYQNRCVSDLEFGFRLLMEHWKDVTAIIFVLLFVGALIWFLLLYGPLPARSD
jgi:hypothetical protein